MLRFILLSEKYSHADTPWDELEKYFGKSRKVLEEEIKEHYMSSGENAAEKNAKLIEVINRNSVVKQG